MPHSSLPADYYLLPQTTISLGKGIDFCGGIWYNMGTFKVSAHLTERPKQNKTCAKEIFTNALYGI